MQTPIPDPFSLTAADLQRLLASDAPYFPELEAARQGPAALLETPQARTVLGQTEPLIADIARIPETRYSHYRAFFRTGDRRAYEMPFFAGAHAARRRLPGAGAAPRRPWTGEQ